METCLHFRVAALNARETGIYLFGARNYGLVVLFRYSVGERPVRWTDSSCNHGYYAHHGFEMVAEFKSDEWKTDSDDYLTYIYRKSF